MLIRNMMKRLFDSYFDVINFGNDFPDQTKQKNNKGDTLLDIMEGEKWMDILEGLV